MIRNIIFYSIIITLFTSCNNSNSIKEKEPVYKKIEFKKLEAPKISEKKTKKLRYLYYSNGGLRGYFDDGTIVGCPRCDLCKENIETLNSLKVFQNYIVREDGSLLVEENEIEIPSEVDTNIKYFEEMSGSVIPVKFWDSANDFIQYGKGFTLLRNGEIASTAYASFVHENKLEIGIETIEKYRGFGFAELTCSRLIDYCLEKDLIPVWSCRFENTASFRLAQKLGFEPITMTPFYHYKLYYLSYINPKFIITTF